MAMLMREISDHRKPQLPWHLITPEPLSARVQSGAGGTPRHDSANFLTAVTSSLLYMYQYAAAEYCVRDSQEARKRGLQYIGSSLF